MKTFALDVWNDLREKRLWPVAAVLALCLIAAPVLLGKSADAPAPPAAPPAARAAPPSDDLRRLAAVKLAERKAPEGSRLSVFSSSDPFRPPASAVQDETADSGGDQGAAGPGSGDTGEAPGGSTGGSGGGSGGSGGGASPGNPTPGGTSPSTTGPGGSGPRDSGGSTDSVKPTVTKYTYVIDVTFRFGSRTRRVKGLKRLETLPSQAAPLLIFLGVDDNAANAVFLVDAKLRPIGEGKCRPSVKQCAFLYLAAGSVHHFLNDKNEASMLRVDQIRKLNVTAATAARTRRTRVPRSARAEKPRRFVLPLFSDLLVSSRAGSR